MQKTFPNAESKSFPDQNAAFLEVATGRAEGSSSRTTCSPSSTSRTATQLKQVAFKKPLHVEYGSYAVQKGNFALAAYLSKFICSQQKSGLLAKNYKATIGAPLPPMPACR